MIPSRFPLWVLLLPLFLLSACSTSGGARYALTADPTAIASGEEEKAEAEENEPLDAWLQALTYRSPDYELGPPPQRNTQLREALKTAFELHGTPYRFGGTSETGLDCSGLVWVSFASVGIKLPRTSQEQFYATERIGRDELQAGDLVFFKTGRSKRRQVDHVGIYIGNGQFLHAPRRGKEVTVASLDESYWTQRFVGAGRVPESAQPKALDAIASARNRSDDAAPPATASKTASQRTASAVSATTKSKQRSSVTAVSVPKRAAKAVSASPQPAPKKKAVGSAAPSAQKKPKPAKQTAPTPKSTVKHDGAIAAR